MRAYGVLEMLPWIVFPGFGFCFALRQEKAGGCGFDYVSAGLSAFFVARHNYVIGTWLKWILCKQMALSRAKQVLLLMASSIW